MPVKPVGGPLDGRVFDAARIAAVGVTPLPTDSGVATFTALPALAVCDHIPPVDAEGRLEGLAIDELTLLPSGEYEFGSATDEGLGGVPEGTRGQGGQDPGERRREFEEHADRLSECVKAAPVGAATGVYLVCRYADLEGNEYLARVSVLPRTWRGFPAGVEAPRVYEAGVHRDAIIGNIHALLRAAPTGWLGLPTKPATKVRLVGFELDVVQTG